MLLERERQSMRMVGIRMPNYSEAHPLPSWSNGKNCRNPHSGHQMQKERWMADCSAYSSLHIPAHPPWATTRHQWMSIVAYITLFLAVVFGHSVRAKISSKCFIILSSCKKKRRSIQSLLPVSGYKLKLVFQQALILFPHREIRNKLRTRSHSTHNFFSNSQQHYTEFWNRAYNQQNSNIRTSNFLFLQMPQPTRIYQSFFHPRSSSPCSPHEYPQRSCKTLDHELLQLFFLQTCNMLSVQICNQLRQLS